MIPAIGLMIAVYGTARLLNDCLNRAPRESVSATVFMVVVSIGGIIGLWFLAFLINAQGMSAGNLGG